MVYLRFMWQTPIRLPIPLKAFLFSLALLFIIAGSKEALALPQFPIRYGQKIYGDAHSHQHEVTTKTMDCRACHVNPSGGGMRNEHGMQFASEMLSFSDMAEEKEEGHGGHGKHQKPEEKKEGNKSIALNEFFSLGGDFRFAYLHAQSESTSAYKDAFFPMQMDIYLLFHPHPRLSLFYQDGILGNRETFGLVRLPDKESHLKFGKFLPPFGLKLDDHTSFIREKLGLVNNSADGSDAGVEWGFANARRFGNIAIFNGAGSGSGSDDNRAKGISGTGGIKTPRAHLAGSFYHNKTGEDSTEITKQYWGVYTAYRVKKLALLGELDFITTEELSKSTSGIVAFAEASVLIRKGIVAKIKVDDYNPDRKQSGDHLKRYTFGVDLYPASHTEVLIQYRKNEEEIERRNDQILVMTHLYF